jgi:hypothetical protein
MNLGAATILHKIASLIMEAAMTLFSLLLITPMMPSRQRLENS